MLQDVRSNLLLKQQHVQISLKSEDLFFSPFKCIWATLTHTHINANAANCLDKVDFILRDRGVTQSGKEDTINCITNVKIYKLQKI